MPHRIDTFSPVYIWPGGDGGRCKRFSPSKPQNAEPNTTYESLAGEKPDPRSVEFIRWMDFLVYRREFNLDPNRHAVTYYFSQDGDDDTGTGEIDNPYKTLAKAAELYDALPVDGDARFRFYSEHTWREPDVDWWITKPDITIDAYGPAEYRPILSTLVPLTGWTTESSYFKAPRPPEVGSWPTWVVVEERVRTLVLTLGGVDTTPNSWNADDDFIYANFDDIDPTAPDAPDISMPRYGVNPIRISGDRVRIDGIVFIGYNFGPYGQSALTEGGIVAKIDFESAEVLVVDCEMYYSGSRGFSLDQSIAAGSDRSYVSFIRCTVGLMARDSSAQWSMGFCCISDSESEPEIVVSDCYVMHGAVPNEDQLFSARCIGFLVGALNSPLIIENACVISASRFGCVRNHLMGVLDVYGEDIDSPLEGVSLSVSSSFSESLDYTLTPIERVKAFVMREVWLGSDDPEDTEQMTATPELLSMASTGVYQANCHYNVTEAAMEGPARGWLVNSVVECDETPQFFRQDDQHRFTLLHNYFFAKQAVDYGEPDLACLVLHSEDQSELAECVMMNCSLVFWNYSEVEGEEGEGEAIASRVGMINASDNISNNAYLVTTIVGTDGFNNDEHRVTLSEALPILTGFRDGEPYWRKGRPVDVSYEFYSGTRQGWERTPNIGPV